MTDVQPPENQSPQPTEVLAAAPSGRRRALIITVVAALVVGVLGTGAWAAYNILSGGGPRPEEALPTSTVAVMSVDLDPSASQKIAAIKAIRKFPSLKKALGLKAEDDLRKFIFDKATESGSCEKLDFEDDVKPWIGKRAALGAVDLGDDEPAPVIALQITDRDKARTGFSRIADCAGAGDDFKWTIGEDYLIASDSQEHADEIQRTGEKTPLADDPAYQRWTEEAGDAGVLNFYVSKKVTKYLSDLLDSLGSEVFGSGDEGFASSDGSFSDEGFAGSSAPRTEDDPDPLASVRDELDKFEGLAGTVRFADGGMELSLAAGGLNSLASTAKVGKQIGSLPGDTVLALGFGVPSDLAEVFTDSFKSGLGSQADDAMASVEDETGLKLPEDLQTLLGTALTLSVGGDAPADLADIESFEDIPVGLVIHGDAAKIKDLIGSIEDHTGYHLADIPIVLEGDDDRVVLSPSRDYADELSKAGSLGKETNFADAVPNAARATGVVYLNFDSAWRDTLLKFAEDDGASAEDVRTADENTEPLKSLGISSWLDGKVSHVLVKIATD